MIRTLGMAVLSPVAAVFLALAPAQSATVNYSTTLPTVAVANPTATSVTAGATHFENVFGTITNVRRSVWQATNSTIDPTASDAFYSAIQNGAVTIEFGQLMQQLSFVWGSPGRLNFVRLFNDGTEVAMLGGATPQDATGPLTVLTTVTNVRFDAVSFEAGAPALEYANLSTIAVIPLPAGGLLLLGGLAALAIGRRRAKRADVGAVA